MLLDTQRIRMQSVTSLTERGSDKAVVKSNWYEFNQTLQDVKYNPYDNHKENIYRLYTKGYEKEKDKDLVLALPFTNHVVQGWSLNLLESWFPYLYLGLIPPAMANSQGQSENQVI